MTRLIKMFAAILVLGLAMVATAHAQATRTWVSGVGDDANPCSRTAPCKTFAGAISKTAASGEISVLDPGGYGAVTITKGIMLNGGGELASTLVSGTNGIVINAGSSDTVILRNIELNGVGNGLNGVLILGAGTVVIDHCTIQGFTGNAVQVAVTSPINVVIRDSTFVGGSNGVVLDATSGPGPVIASVSNTTFQGMANGVHTSRGHISVVNSVFQGNASYGAFAEIGSIEVSDSLFTNNGTAVQASAAGAVSIVNNRFFNNAVGIGSGGGLVMTDNNNRFANNGTAGAPNWNMSIK